MFEVFKKIFELFNDQERKHFYLLMCLMVFVAFTEVLGISTLLLLLKVFSEPENITLNPYSGALFSRLSFSSIFAFQVFLAGLVFIVVVIGLLIKALGTYAIIRFSNMRGYSMSIQLLEAYLHQPYSWFIGHNSADINKVVLTEIEQAVTRVVMPGLNLLANILLAGAIIVFLIIVEPLIAIIAAFLIGGGYSLIYVSVRGHLLRLGERRFRANTARFRITHEATGGFKELKIMNLEDMYVQRFREPAKDFATTATQARSIDELPRYALEMLTFAVLLGAILTMLVRNSGDLTAAIPTLGIFAFSVMKLLPALQKVYYALSSIRNGIPFLDKIYDDYTTATSFVSHRPVSTDVKTRMPLLKNLELRDISFSYPETERVALQKISFELSATSIVGIVGGTGAGKTTIVDLILGLLTPHTGNILVDGEALNRENIQAWQRSLGYVPQTIYLSDSTIRENIAFGTAPKDIDSCAVERAAKIASLHDFIVKDLPQGYDTAVGERGVRLSGGQRQRIGIARAMYHDPSLLIMDEATSALDNITERAVMDAVKNIGREKTVIMIAHRLSTVRNCDKIILFENGAVSHIGDFDLLVKNSDTFSRMAESE